MPFGSTSINLYPPPATNITGGLVILYAATPPSPTLATERYQVPLGNDTAIVSYCLYKAALKATPGALAGPLQPRGRDGGECDGGGWGCALAAGLLPLVEP